VGLWFLPKSIIFPCLYPFRRPSLEVFPPSADKIIFCFPLFVCAPWSPRSLSSQPVIQILDRAGRNHEHKAQHSEKKARRVKVPKSEVSKAEVNLDHPSARTHVNRSPTPGKEAEGRGGLRFDFPRVRRPEGDLSRPIQRDVWHQIQVFTVS
jgi:hypothetical protein